MSQVETRIDISHDAPQNYTRDMSHDAPQNYTRIDGCKPHLVCMHKRVYWGMHEAVPS